LSSNGITSGVPGNSRFRRIAPVAEVRQAGCTTFISLAGWKYLTARVEWPYRPSTVHLLSESDAALLGVSTMTRKSITGWWLWGLAAMATAGVLIPSSSLALAAHDEGVNDA
jgi:hypothetical protein